MSDVRGAIQNLLFQYAECIDAGDLEGVADILAHAEVTGEGSDAVTKGREAILNMYRVSTRIYPDTGTPKTKHVTSNAIIEVDEEGGRAESRSYFTVFQQTETLPLQPIIAGRYHDRFECVDGEWRFSGRHMICDLFGDLSQHLLFDAKALT